ncbi:MAG: hypothetical protein LBS34_01555 [Rickettsiales bacterium]|nr:hypothetical protein [Rickettsiales bacterium]
MPKVLANPACVVCTVAIGASLTVAKLLGVRDSVVGPWIGALLMIIGYHIILLLDKKKWNFWWRDQIVLLLSISTVSFLYFKDLNYSPKPIFIFYLDPFLFSVVLGSLVFICSQKLYQWMKVKNGGHAHFPFEKVVLPLFMLYIVSVLVTYYQL